MRPVHDCNWSALNIPILTVVFNEDPEIVMLWRSVHFSNVVGALHLFL